MGMRTMAVAAVFISATWIVGASATRAERPVEAVCPPTAELSFLCGIEKPEDVLALPGDRWLVASGMAARSGLHLIDSRARTWERWIAPATTGPRAPFQRCPSQSPADALQVHGISFRSGENGHGTLYAVNHGGLENVTDLSEGGGHETIEVFDVDMNRSKPALSWIGCVAMPEKRAANSVVAASDGTIYVSVMMLPGTADLAPGRPTGTIYKWVPGTDGFVRLGGSDLALNNGIELSRDEKTLYVASLTAVNAFTNSSPLVLQKTVPIKIGFGDNLHWVHDRLILAGPRTDVCPPDAGAFCMGGYYVASVDPQSLELEMLAKGSMSPAFSGVSWALPLGSTLWIGSHSDNKLAYRTLP